MKTSLIRILCLVVFLNALAAAQEVNSSLSRHAARVHARELSRERVFLAALEDGSRR